MIDFLTAPHSGPVWAVIGILISQLANFVLGLRTSGTNEVVAATTAHANLNKSLQQSFEVMAKELERLRKDHEEEVERYQARIRALEEELERMHQLLFQSDATGCNGE